MRGRGRSEVVVADSANEDDGIAPHWQQLGRCGARIVCTEEVATSGGEPRGHRRNVELLLGRPEAIDREAEQLRELVLSRLEPVALIGGRETA